MRSTIIALALSGMLTVEQGDPHRKHFDPPSAAFSEDGRFIAFTSFARLAPADLDDRRDVYVLDRVDQRVTLESAALEGLGASHSSHPAVSGDGRFLLYETGAHIVLRDRQGGSSRVVAVGRQPVISADGKVAAFTSDPLNDICVADLEKGDVNCIGGRAIGGVSPSLSGNGRHLAFSALGSVFVHDRETGTINRVAAGWDPAISADGEWIAFVYMVRRVPVVMLADLRTGTSQTVSRSRSGRGANGRSANPAISRDGRVVAFQSEASNMVDDEDYNLLWDVFLFDRTTGMMSRVSGDSHEGWMEPSGGPALSAAGDAVAFCSRHPTDAADNDNDFDLFVAAIDLRAPGAAQAPLRPVPGPGVLQRRIPDAPRPRAAALARPTTPFPG